jgi:hypothetical protein
MSREMLHRLGICVVESAGSRDGGKEMLRIHLIPFFSEMIKMYKEKRTRKRGGGWAGQEWQPSCVGESKWRRSRTKFVQ